MDLFDKIKSNPLIFNLISFGTVSILTILLGDFSIGSGDQKYSDLIKIVVNGLKLDKSMNMFIKRR